MARFIPGTISVLASIANPRYNPQFIFLFIAQFFKLQPRLISAYIYLISSSVSIAVPFQGNSIPVPIKIPILNKFPIPNSIVYSLTYPSSSDRFHIWYQFLSQILIRDFSRYHPNPFYSLVQSHSRLRFHLAAIVSCVDD